MFAIRELALYVSASLPDVASIGLFVQSTLGQPTMSDGSLGTYEAVKVCKFSIFFLFGQSDCLQYLHKTVPAFSPYVPVGLLSYLAFILLTGTFGLAFYYTTYVIIVSDSVTVYIRAVHSLSKSTIPTREATVAIIASILGGYGVVALFCSVGVYV